MDTFLVLVGLQLECWEYHNPQYRFLALWYGGAFFFFSCFRFKGMLFSLFIL